MLFSRFPDIWACGVKPDEIIRTFDDLGEFDGNLKKVIKYHPNYAQFSTSEIERLVKFTNDVATPLFRQKGTMTESQYKDEKGKIGS